MFHGVIICFGFGMFGMWYFKKQMSFFFNLIGGLVCFCKCVLEEEFERCNLSADDK